MLPYLAILIPSMLLCCGIAVDVGLMQMHKLQMQSASDAAAFAAELEYERGTGNWVSAGQADAAINGFTNGSGGTTVNVAMRPSTGTYAAWYDAIQTTITQPQPSTFLKLLSNNTATLSTRSVALVTPCVYLTGSKGLTTYQLSTMSATLNSNCPYYINKGAMVDASSSVAVLAANLTGPSGSSSWGSPSNAPPPRYGAKTLADPLGSIAQPAAGGCAVTDYNSGSTPTTFTSNQTAYPATYCGNSYYPCSSNSVVLTLNPGLYVFAGTLDIRNCTVNGNGVTLFFTKDPNRGTYGKLYTNNATVNISASGTTSGGAIPGITVMTDRNWIPTNPRDFILERSSLNGDGIWYLTNAGLQIKSGVFTAPNYGGLVADNLDVYVSTLNLPSNFSSISGGNPFRPLGGLAE